MLLLAGGAASASAPSQGSKECLRTPALLSAAADPKAEEAWTLKLSWSGGFFSQPPKTITITSSGHAIAQRGAGCLSAGDREGFATLLKLARPESWRACYGVNPCCDRFSYEFQFAQPREGQMYRITWYSGDDGSMPPDLHAIIEAMQRIGRATIPPCPATVGARTR